MSVTTIMSAVMKPFDTAGRRHQQPVRAQPHADVAVVGRDEAPLPQAAADFDDVGAELIVGWASGAQVLRCSGLGARGHGAQAASAGTRRNRSADVAARRRDDAVLGHVRAARRAPHERAAEPLRGPSRPGDGRRRGVRAAAEQAHHQRATTISDDQRAEAARPRSHRHAYLRPERPCRRAPVAPDAPTFSPSSPCFARRPSSLSGAMATTCSHDSAAPARSCLPKARMMPWLSSVFRCLASIGERPVDLGQRAIDLVRCSSRPRPGPC